MAVIALDLGGTKLAAALFSEKGDILFKTTRSLDKKQGTEVGRLISREANEILSNAEKIKESVSAIGICVPGIAHAKTATVWAPNIPGWDNYPLLEELKHSIDNKKIKIKIDSDRACYVLGETWKGNARGCSDAIFLSVGTGIGAGILINNEVLRGANDIAGAIGWMALDKPFKEKYISCGDFEYNASGEGILKVAKEMLSDANYNESILKKFNPEELSTKAVFDGYERGDALSIKVIKNAIEYWGMVVANLVSLFNPEKIIFGGGVFGPALKFLDLIYDEAKKWAQPISIRQVKLQGSALGNDAGLYGAGLLALKD
ncbi:MAG TPA: ROK family protein [Chitinophagaceae bacterium]|nr:ROK family protein [Chitinophagaceae bacterium]